jgi:hypothetical protein
MGVRKELQDQAALPHGNCPHYILDGRLGESQSYSGYSGDDGE